MTISTTSHPWGTSLSPFSWFQSHYLCKSYQDLHIFSRLWFLQGELMPLVLVSMLAVDWIVLVAASPVSRGRMERTADLTCSHRCASWNHGNGATNQVLLEQHSFIFHLWKLEKGKEIYGKNGIRIGAHLVNRSIGHWLESQSSDKFLYPLSSSQISPSPVFRYWLTYIYNRIDSNGEKYSVNLLGIFLNIYMQICVSLC